MKKAILLHNPGAGEETHKKEDLLRLVEDAGYEPEYRSQKDLFWKRGLTKADLIVVAGGDGTVRKTAAALLKKKLPPPPMAILPFGTANNLSKTLNGIAEAEEIASRWKGGSVKPFDVGQITGLSKNHFFIEGLGFGVFPALVRVMKLVDEALSDEPEKRIDTALGLLGGILRSYKAKPCQITIDGVDHSGNYLLVEIMNICSIGPNLRLADQCDPGDGQFHVVVVPEDGRDDLLDYVSRKIKGEETPAGLPLVRGTNISLRTAERRIHIDDMLVKTAGNVPIEVSLDRSRLSFLT